jgi:hypothetical protein
VHPKRTYSQAVRNPTRYALLDHAADEATLWDVRLGLIDYIDGQPVGTHQPMTVELRREPGQQLIWPATVGGRERDPLPSDRRSFETRLRCWDSAHACPFMVRCPLWRDIEFANAP